MHFTNLAKALPGLFKITKIITENHAFIPEWDNQQKTLKVLQDLLNNQDQVDLLKIGTIDVGGRSKSTKDILAITGMGVGEWEIACVWFDAYYKGMGKDLEALAEDGIGRIHLLNMMFLHHADNQVVVGYLPTFKKLWQKTDIIILASYHLDGDTVEGGREGGDPTQTKRLYGRPSWTSCTYCLPSTTKPEDESFTSHPGAAM